MAWMIVRIEPRANADRPERESEPVVELLRQRFPLHQPALSEYRRLLEKHGYEMAPHVGPPPADLLTYIFIAYAYVSGNRRGHGRQASSLHRLLVRKAKR